MWQNTDTPTALLYQTAKAVEFITCEPHHQTFTLDGTVYPERLFSNYVGGLQQT